MRLLPALALAALVLPAALPAAQASDPVTPDVRNDTAPFAARGSTALQLELRSGAFVSLHVVLGAADSQRLTVAGPGACRGSLELRASEAAVLDCGWLPAGTHRLTLASGGTLSTGAVRAYGAHFPSA